MCEGWHGMVWDGMRRGIEYCVYFQIIKVKTSILQLNLPGDTAIITTIVTTTKGFELILFAHLHASATGDKKNKPHPNNKDPDQDLIVQRSIICVVIEIRVKIIGRSGTVIVLRR